MLPCAMFTIETGVPLPLPKSDYSDHPFKRMDVGQSIVVPIEDRKYVYRLRLAIWKHSKKHGVKYTSRVLPEGLRIWRTV